MLSSVICRISALVLFFGGLTLLFASDVLLPFFAPGIPSSATWLGQLVSAGWLGLAALNWLSRGSLIGGIYGRPLVTANLATYFITAMVLIRAAMDNSGPQLAFLIGLPLIAPAALYGWLLLRGPFHRDLPAASGR